MATIRYWAAARAAAGVLEETFDAGTLAELIDAACAAHPEPRFAQVIRRCAWVVGDAPIGGRDRSTVELTAESIVEALPPFAGGTG